MTQSGPFTLRVYDPEAGEVVEAGTWTLDESGVIDGVEARPGHEALLARAAAELNAEAGLQLRAPPGEGAVPGAMYLQYVERGEPAFVDAMREYLLTYYGIGLAPASAEPLEATSES